MSILDRLRPKARTEAVPADVLTGTVLFTAKHPPTDTVLPMRASADAAPVEPALPPLQDFQLEDLERKGEQDDIEWGPDAPAPAVTTADEAAAAAATAVAVDEAFGASSGHDMDAADLFDAFSSPPVPASANDVTVDALTYEHDVSSSSFLTASDSEPDVPTFTIGGDDPMPAAPVAAPVPARAADIAPPAAMDAPPTPEPAAPHRQEIMDQFADFLTSGD